MNSWPMCLPTVSSLRPLGFAELLRREPGGRKWGSLPAWLYPSAWLRPLADMQILGNRLISSQVCLVRWLFKVGPSNIKIERESQSLLALCFTIFFIVIFLLLSPYAFPEDSTWVAFHKSMLRSRWPRSPGDWRAWEAVAMTDRANACT